MSRSDALPKSTAICVSAIYRWNRGTQPAVALSSTPVGWGRCPSWQSFSLEPSPGSTKCTRKGDSAETVLGQWTSAEHRLCTRHVANLSKHCWVYLQHKNPLGGVWCLDPYLALWTSASCSFLPPQPHPYHPIQLGFLPWTPVPFGSLSQFTDGNNKSFLSRGAVFSGQNPARKAGCWWACLILLSVMRSLIAHSKSSRSLVCIRICWNEDSKAPILVGSGLLSKGRLKNKHFETRDFQAVWGNPMLTCCPHPLGAGAPAQTSRLGLCFLASCLCLWGVLWPRWPSGSCVWAPGDVLSPHSALLSSLRLWLFLRQQCHKHLCLWGETPTVWGEEGLASPQCRLSSGRRLNFGASVGAEFPGRDRCDRSGASSQPCRMTGIYFSGRKKVEWKLFLEEESENGQRARRAWGAKKRACAEGCGVRPRRGEGPGQPCTRRSFITLGRCLYRWTGWEKRGDEWKLGDPVGDRNADWRLSQ